MNLVRELSGNNPEDVIGYNIHLKTRKFYEKKINIYLRRLLTEYPEEFERRYYRWEYHNKEAQKMFPSILRMYGWTTKKATLGKFDNRRLDENPCPNLLEDIIYIGEDDIFHVSILKRNLLSRSRYDFVSRLSFPAESLKRMGGTVNDFFIVTDTMHVEFKEKGVKILIHPKKRRGEYSKS
ncbi:MAG: hypothetical protein PHQ43_02875 [Dehalococcoidales bacterium]|nr:hypothetical protein [Dehalococcoidales bacterium]